MGKKSDRTDIKYRLNVAAILRNSAGKILIGEREDRAGAWQFPQGGVDEGESLVQALARELQEEISVKPSAYRVVHEKGPYYYQFGSGKVVKGFHGKQQHYFLADFIGSADDIDVETEHPEFRAIRWVAPEEFKIDWLPKMKRDVYRQVFKDFFGLKLQ
jgi:putative (di)nucleoside polyphosphate hydrolase